jgi:hypothetical protein
MRCARRMLYVYNKHCWDCTWLLVHNIIKSVWSLRGRKEEKIRFTTSHSPWEPSARNRTHNGRIGPREVQFWLVNIVVRIVIVTIFFSSSSALLYFECTIDSNPICGLAYMYVHIYIYIYIYTRPKPAKHGGRPCRTGNKQRDTRNILHSRMYTYKCTCTLYIMVNH